jgi:hypothetical protein
MMDQADLHLCLEVATSCTEEIYKLVQAAAEDGQSRGPAKFGSQGYNVALLERGRRVAGADSWVSNPLSETAGRSLFFVDWDDQTAKHIQSVTKKGFFGMRKAVESDLPGIVGYESLVRDLRASVVDLDSTAVERSPAEVKKLR